MKMQWLSVLMCMLMFTAVTDAGASRGQIRKILGPVIFRHIVCYSCARIQSRQLKLLKHLRGNALLVATILSVFIGATIGLLCRRFQPTAETIALVEFPGEIFIRMLKMLMVPLIVSSMITGVAGMDSQSSGKMGLFTIAYYISTTVIAIIVGFILVFSIKPGNIDFTTTNQAVSDIVHQTSSKDVFMDLVRNLFPDNLVRAAFQSTGTVYTRKEASKGGMVGNETIPPTTGANLSTNVTHDTQHDDDVTWVGKLAYTPGVNTIGLLVYCCVFGAILGKMGKSGKVLLKFFNGITIITMKMVTRAMLYSPIGILTLIAGKILAVEDLAETAQHLGMYMVTGLTGLFIHAVIVIPLIYYIFTRRNPFTVTLGILQALVTALGTDSSSATLPVTIRCCEQKLKIDKTITRFVLPIGATINMDGGAMFQVITPVYLAQLSRINLDFVQMVTLGLAATLASIGAAGIPGTGLIVSMMVMSSVGLPVKDIFMIMAIDWFLGRTRTMTNVSGDCFAASILQHLFKPGLAGDDPNKPDGEDAAGDATTVEAKMLQDDDVV
ncbi:excitatory amino acid transporter 3-like [Haliotis asinina]|uniref:excitatory amino acid transporter 3-like n=1 Tax=Haliotis asinina TaxID=109174 RepID=UPI00353218B3